jgi:hypothetical protein
MGSYSSLSLSSAITFFRSRRPPAAASVGFLTHTGYSHGGNGFEGMAFLLDQFKDKNLEDPTIRNTASTSRRWPPILRRPTRARKQKERNSAPKVRARCLECITRCSKGNPINHDPRERFIAKVMEERSDYNVFHDFYRQLVQALYDVGASPYVFCVNVDAVIAALLLALLWKDYKSGALGGGDLETAALRCSSTAG